MKALKTKINSGQTLVEVLVAAAIFSLILTPFLSSLLNLTRAQVKYRHQTQATQYAREGLEIVYNIAVNTDSWADFAAYANNPDPNNPDLYYPVPIGMPSVYTLLSLQRGTQSLAGGTFLRAIFFQKARRDDVSGNLSEDPTAPEDSNTIKTTSRVSWQEGGREQKVEFNTYLIDLTAF